MCRTGATCELNPETTERNEKYEDKPLSVRRGRFGGAIVRLILAREGGQMIDSNGDGDSDGSD